MTKRKILLILFLFLVAALAAIKFTRSSFSDTEKTLGNSIQVGTWGTTITPTPTEIPPGVPTPTPTEIIVPTPTETPTQTPTPTNTPTPTLTNTPTPTSPVVGSVVINELMWMGSANSEHLSDDEWIELRSTTGSPIELTGWKIDSAGLGSASVTLSGTIPANGYFLLSHYNSDHSAINDSISVDQVVPSLSLSNGGEQLTLKNNLDAIIDQTPAGAWAAGSNEVQKQSMERNNDPSTGWHTCTNATCNDTTYWDTEGSNYGTPKAANL